MEFFISNFLAVLQIFILGLFGFYILKKGILGECCLNILTNLVIDITLPCFIFSTIVTNFSQVAGTAWYVIPPSFFGILFLSIILCLFYFRLDKTILEKKEFISLVSFPNVGFLPIVIVNSLFPEKQARELSIYIFLFVMFFNPVFFTLAETIFSKEKKAIFDVRQIFNPAFLVTVFSLIVVFAGAEKCLPQFITKPVSLMGQATIPISMIVIGGALAVNFRTKQKINFPFVLKVSFFKLIVIPLIVIFLIKDWGISEQIKFVIVLEALVPSAVNNLLLARKYEGEHILIGQSVFVSHILSLITIPLFLTFFKF